MAALEAGAKQAAELTEKQTARNGGEEKFSIKYDRDNTPYVVIETDILTGVPKSQWVKTVKDNLRQKFPNGVTVGRNVININSQSRREMTFSKYMQHLFKTEPQIYADKLRATNNADEIVRAARNWVNEALLHARKDAIIDFARGEVLLRVGDNDYIAQVIVGNRGESNLLLYDIVDLAPTAIQEKHKTGAENITKAKKQPGDRASAPVKDSIAQAGGDVKKKFSPEAETRYSLKEDSQGRTLTAEQQAFFKDSKARDEDGNLLVVYHGTDADFTVFDRTKGRANMDIQGMFFSPWEVDAGGYGGKVGAYYLNLTNPADEGTGYKALKRFQGQNDAGTKAREYLIQQGYDGVNNGGEEYIAFFPEQIKRVDNKNPTSNPDINFSLKGTTLTPEVEALQEQVKDLQKRVQIWQTRAEHFKGELKRTEAATVDGKAVRKAAGPPPLCPCPHLFHPLHGSTHQKVTVGRKKCQQPPLLYYNTCDKERGAEHEAPALPVLR